LRNQPEPEMTKLLRRVYTALCIVGVLAVATGCETLQPQGIVMEPIENFGGGGGDAA
jgi:hypothetical protein